MQNSTKLQVSKLIKKTFVKQQEQSDCGISCLLSILKFHGGLDYTFEHLRELSGTTKQGTTLLGLYQASQSLGFNAEGLEAESIDNLEETITDPVILHVIINRRKHYYVYYGKSQNKYIIGDPGQGIIFLTRQELEKVWVDKTLLQLWPKSLERHSARKSKAKSFYKFLKQDIPILIAALTIGIIISTLMLSTAVFSQKLIDNILPSESTIKLVISLILLFLLLVARSGLSYIRGFFLLHQSKEFNNRIIKEFYNKLLKLPKRFFDSRKTGELIARMNDTRRIQSVISTLFGNLLIDLLLMFTSTLFIFLYSWILGIICLLFIPIYFFIIYKSSNSLSFAQKSVMSSYAHTESNYVDTISGVVSIKSHGLETFFEKINENIYGIFQGNIFKLGKINIKMRFLSDIMGVAFILSVYATTSWLVINEQLLIGELVAIATMSGTIIPSVTRLVMFNVQFQEVKVVFERMFEFTESKPESMNRHAGIKIHKWKTLEINNLSFRFTGRSQLLKDVSLFIRKGDFITLLGESGSGKSTLIQVLLGFYNHEEGEVIINNHLINNLNLQQWRQKIGIVPQEVKIFNGSLIYNICLSEQEKEIRDSIKYCKGSGFDTFFEKLPHGYNTLVGEEGINLSGGQKQLIAIARALYKNPQLLLLDEATSAMDSNTENFILNLLYDLKKQVGILMVSHRLKIAKRSDRVYILENGSISETGTPEELLKTDNFYSKTYFELIG